MRRAKIVLLVGDSESSYVYYNYLIRFLEIESVILEGKKKNKGFVKRRIKKLGLWKVIGQILFVFFISKPLNFISKRRRLTILNEGNFDSSPINTEANIDFVSSVNSEKVISVLDKVAPDIVLVNGTSIISKRILERYECPFINLHVGITPKYRGVHGGYWALVNNDLENCGVTIHYIDSGIDTGKVIKHINISITDRDTFATYPVLQLIAGIKEIPEIINDIINQKNPVGNVINGLESKLWTHPTIWEYIYYRIIRGIK